MSFLTLTNISKTFKETTAVADFNLDVTRGEFVSFLGPSGCGKTTTLRMIAGFETATTGSIVINGEEVTHRPPNRRNVGMVFQSYALFPNLTVAGNIGFGLMVAKRPKAEIRQTVAEMLDVIHLPQLGNRYPYQLSGGQQQRVALARALAIHPEVLLLDEPLSALDAKIRVELRTEIRRIQQRLGITTIYVTHDQEEALSISDRIVVMNAGRVDQIGTPVEIYNYPRSSFVASFIGQLNLLPVTVQDAAGGVVALGGEGGQLIRTGQPIQAARGRGPEVGGSARRAQNRAAARQRQRWRGARQPTQREVGRCDVPGRHRAGQGGARWSRRRPVAVGGPAQRSATGAAEGR